jgi:hypothetical protein
MWQNSWAVLLFMEGEIVLENSIGQRSAEEEGRPFGRLEESVRHLLIRYHEILKENEELARALRLERERNDRLGKLEVFRRPGKSEDSD